MAILSLGRFIKIHKDRKAKDGLRLGQRFVNMYMKDAQPDLYYEEDEARAQNLIFNWLIDHHYTEELPQEIPACSSSTDRLWFLNASERSSVT